MTAAGDTLRDQVPEKQIHADLLWAVKGLALQKERWNGAAGNRRLAKFLRHAIETVPFYRSLRLASSRGAPALHAFPTISRSDISRHRRNFMSGRFEDRRFSVATSGTTAAPVEIPFDTASWCDFNYSMYDAFAAAHPALRPTFPFRGLGVALVTTKRKRKRSSTIIPSLRCSILKRLVIGRNAEEDDAVLEYLRSVRLPLLHGKPSYLLALMDLDERNRNCGIRRIRPNNAIVSGETLHDGDRRRLERWFGGNVLNAYASVEGGPIALECEHKRGMHLLSDRVRMEVMTDGGLLAPEGTGNLVLTNLGNWSFPLVRYDTGDLGTVAVDACPCGFAGQTITSLPGKEPARLRNGDREVAVEIVAAIFERLDVWDYRVEQYGLDLQVRWTPRWGLAEAGVRWLATTETLTNALRRLFPAARIGVSAVPRIERRGTKRICYVRSDQEPPRSGKLESRRRPSGD